MSDTQRRVFVAPNEPTAIPAFSSRVAVERMLHANPMDKYKMSCTLEFLDRQKQVIYFVRLMDGSAPVQVSSDAYYVRSARDVTLLFEVRL